MLILQLAPFVLILDEMPVFPAETIIHCKLSPGELFGTAPGSGKLSVLNPGQTVKMNYDAAKGEIRIPSGVVLRKVDLAPRKLNGLEVRIAGDDLTVTWTSTSEANFHETVGNLDVLVPAALAGRLPCPIYLGELRGTVGGVSLRFEVSATTSRALRTVEVERCFAASIDELDAALNPSTSARIVSAHRYLLQARRLGYASSYATEFIGERLLNLYKALEVFFGRNADQLRSELKKLGVQEDQAEGLFVALLYVRDNLDVGHCAIRPLNEKNWSRVVAFAERAEEGMTALLSIVCKAVAAGTYQLRPNKTGDRDDKLLSTIEKFENVYMEPYAGFGDAGKPWRIRRVPEQVK